MMMFNKGLKTLESRYKNIYFQSETKANYIISQSMITFSVEHNNVSNSEFSSLCKMKRTV